MEIEPDAWPAVQLWLRVQTQWRVVGMGSAIGLDYPAVFAVMDRAKIADPDGRLFEDLQVMEIAALRALRKD